MKKALPALAIAMASLLGSAAYAADAPAAADAPPHQSVDAGGDAIARTCFGCHGVDGVSRGAAPPLKGLPASYLEQAMTNFKSGARPATIMDRIAKGYSEGEIKAMADYFASLK
ncbi:MAG: c-type cytochrome [Gammaproteobacteria bacterium]|nr:c-type cytochrome [Gammaproteobacteria bacterium]